MSKLLRSLKLNWVWYDYILDFLDKRPDWYYNVKNYLRNFILFNKLAWGYRSWDSHYSITVFANLIVDNGRACRHGHSVNGKKQYRRALTAAGLLSRAYDYNCTKDKGYMYLAHKYPYKIVKGQLTMDSKREVVKKLQEMAILRVYRVEASLKREAWAYIAKYVEHFWD